MPIFVAKMKRFREPGRCKGKENFRDNKGKNNEVEGKNKRKGETRKANVRVTEV